VVAVIPSTCLSQKTVSENATEIKGSVFKSVAIPLRSSSKMSRSKPPRPGSPVVRNQAGRLFHRSTCVPLVFPAPNLRQRPRERLPHHRSRANRGTSGRWALGADEQPEFESDARSGDQGAREERLKHNEGSGWHGVTMLCELGADERSENR